MSGAVQIVTLHWLERQLSVDLQPPGIPHDLQQVPVAEHPAGMGAGKEVDVG